MKKLEHGRSMIEMLGVLAIVGVLSVGAIAGYSKAMMKYKLNKQAQQLNTIINAVAKHAHSFDNLQEAQSILPYLVKMGEIPKEMIVPNYPEIIRDVFNMEINTRISPYSTTVENAVKGVVSLIFHPRLTLKSNENLEICKNIFTVIKENSSSIYYGYSGSGYNTDDFRQSVFYGDNYCSQGDNCIKDLTVEKIYSECSLHVGNNVTETGTIYILWKL